MRNGQRIGILGGTFDPVHNGHLAIAQEVQHRLKLDQIRFVPAAQPPHKPNYSIAPFEDRVAMLETALADQPAFTVSLLEAELPGPSYTIDTLKALRHRLGEDVRLFFVIGLDAFAEINTWKKYARLPQEADFVVITRPTHNPETARDIIENFFPKYEFDAKTGAWRSRNDSASGRIHILNISPLEISSTKIRELFRSGKAITHLVPSGIEEYIREHGLYGKEWLPV